MAGSLNSRRVNQLPLMPAKDTVAAHLVRSLVARGVERLFSLSGNQILSIYEACREQGVEIVHVRHEAAAVHMADAWGRLTGTPGVALITAGPGHANGLSALYVAREAESPLILLSGAAPAGHLGTFQEMPQEQLAAPICKAAATLTDPAQVQPLLAWAWETALSGRPGPVSLTLPSNVLEAAAPPQAAQVPAAQPSAIDQVAITPVVQQLASARRPLVLAGPAFCRGDRAAALDRFAQSTGIPALATESPRGIKDPHLGAFTEVLAAADLVLLVGKKLDWSLKFGQAPPFRSDCRLVQFDADSQVIAPGRAALGDDSRLLSLCCDPLAALATLEQQSDQAAPQREAAWPGFVAQAVAWRPDDWVFGAFSWRIESRTAGRVHPLDVCLALREWLRPEDIFISDGGEFGQWAQAVLHTPRRVINGPSGSIGGSLPFALAARLADPKARVLVTLGDGTFGFHAMEFETAVRHNLPLVALVGNDARWNAECQLQAAQYGENHLYGCELLPTRYDRVVAALGGHGEHVTQLDELPAALERAFASDLPACVNVDILPMPAPVFDRATS